MSKRWYLVHAKARQEFVAEANLRRQGYETFLPTRRETVRRAGRFQAVRVAHFPSYLFVALDGEGQRWRPINHTLGVRRIYATGERPSPAPKGLVETLKGIATPEGVIASDGELALGQRVRLTDGPLAGYDGVIEALVGDDRVRVLLELMDGRASVLISRAALATS